MKRHIVALIVFFLFLVSLAGMTMWMLSRAEEGLKDEHAPMWAADLIVEHLKSHEDVWPGSWEELRITCTYLCAVGWKHSDFAFDDLRKRVEVDFTADPIEVVSSSSAPRLVVKSKSPDEEFDGDDPNILIHDYLRRKFDPTRRSTAEIDAEE